MAHGRIKLIHRHREAQTGYQVYDVGERRTIMLTFTFTLNETLDYDWFVLPTTTLAFVFFCNCIFNLCVYFDKLYCTLVKLLNTWSLFRSTFMGSP